MSKTHANYQKVLQAKDEAMLTYMNKLTETYSRVTSSKQAQLDDTKQKLLEAHMLRLEKYEAEKKKQINQQIAAERKLREKEQQVAQRLKDFRTRREHQSMLRAEQERLNFTEAVSQRQRIDQLRIKRHSDLLANRAKRNEELERREQALAAFELGTRHKEYAMARDVSDNKMAFSTKAARLLSKTSLL